MAYSKIFEFRAEIRTEWSRLGQPLIFNNGPFSSRSVIEPNLCSKMTLLRGEHSFFLKCFKKDIKMGLVGLWIRVTGDELEGDHSETWIILSSIGDS